jgi:hypothetical protein
VNVTDVVQLHNSGWGQIVKALGLKRGNLGGEGKVQQP